MQRVYYSAGLSPESFWAATMDEVLLVVKGKTDEWRINRNNAFLIHRSLVVKPVDMFKELPLPFDEEIIQMQDEALTNDLEALYNLAKLQWADG